MHLHPDAFIATVNPTGLHSLPQGRCVDEEREEEVFRVPVPSDVGRLDQTADFRNVFRRELHVVRPEILLEVLYGKSCGEVSTFPMM